LAGKVWRIGLMGHSCQIKNVIYCLGALETVLAEMRAPIARGVAIAAALQAFAD
jgi:alanine-glyoxylate transaminase/serine-glyoxylate transaminase/serine-pyruvate transaminase